MRAYVQANPGAVENLIMAAPVQRGSIEAFRVFVRGERFIRRAFTPKLVATWPFVFELLPEDGRVFVDEDGRAVERDLWDRSAWPLDVSRQLLAARAFRDELRTRPTDARVTVIAGDCVPTAIRVLTRRDGTYIFYPNELRNEENRLAPMLFEPGDGTVPVSSAKASGDALLFCDGHQGIAADPNVHRAIIRTLRQ